MPKTSTNNASAAAEAAEAAEQAAAEAIEAADMASSKLEAVADIGRAVLQESRTSAARCEAASQVSETAASSATYCLRQIRIAQQHMHAHMTQLQVMQQQVLQQQQAAATAETTAPMPRSPSPPYEWVRGSCRSCGHTTHVKKPLLKKKPR